MKQVVAILDFETTGLSPDLGDRVTEVAVVFQSNGKIVDRYQSLINPKRPIPAFVQSLTGITDAMVRKAPEASQVMHELYRKIGDVPLIAHNASFDSKFLDAEWARIGLRRQAAVACSLLLSRRLYPNSPSHRLGALVSHLSLPSSGTFHRAMADAEMTAHLLARIICDLKTRHGLTAVTHEMLTQLQVVKKSSFASAIGRYQN